MKKGRLPLDDFFGSLGMVNNKVPNIPTFKANLKECHPLHEQKKEAGFVVGFFRERIFVEEYPSIKAGHIFLSGGEGSWAPSTDLQPTCHSRPNDGIQSYITRKAIDCTILCHDSTTIFVLSIWSPCSLVKDHGESKGYGNLPPPTRK